MVFQMPLLHKNLLNSNSSASLLILRYKFFKIIKNATKKGNAGTSAGIDNINNLNIVRIKFCTIWFVLN